MRPTEGVCGPQAIDLSGTDGQGGDRPRGLSPFFLVWRLPVEHWTSFMCTSPTIGSAVQTPRSSDEQEDTAL